MNQTLCLILFLTLFTVPDFLFGNSNYIAASITDITNDEADQEIRNFEFRVRTEIGIFPSADCFRVIDIRYEGAEVLPISEMDNLTSELFFRCFEFSILEKKLLDIGRWYALNGYPTSRAYFSEKSELAAGVLVIRLAEGKINKITLNNESNWRDKMGVLTAFPFLDGEILNMADIEQGLEQLNRLYSRKAEMKIHPSSEPGESDVKVTSKDGDRFKSTISTSNSGSEIYGIYPITLTQVMENLLGLNESITLSRNANEQTLNNPEHSYSNSATFNIPFGYWDMTLSVSQSEYSREIETIYADYISSGVTNSEILKLNYLLARLKGAKLALELGMAHNSTKSYVDDTLVEVSSRDYTNGSIGLSLSYFLPTFNVKLNPEWKTGLDWFNADPDPEDIREYEPHAKFSLWSFNGSIGGKFGINSPFGYSSYLYSQYSETTLYGSDQIGIGGLSTVRGFKKNSISGDSGYYWMNGLTATLSGNYKLLPKQSVINFGIHYDRGCIREYYTGAVYCLSGGAASLSFSWAGLSLSYTYGVPISGSKLFIEPEKSANYISASYSIYWDF